MDQFGDKGGEQHGQRQHQAQIERRQEPARLEQALFQDGFNQVAVMHAVPLVRPSCLSTNRAGIWAKTLHKSGTRPILRPWPTITAWFPAPKKARVTNRVPKRAWRMPPPNTRRRWIRLACSGWKAI